MEIFVFSLSWGGRRRSTDWRVGGSSLWRRSAGLLFRRCRLFAWEADSRLDRRRSAGRRVLVYLVSAKKTNHKKRLSNRIPENLSIWNVQLLFENLAYAEIHIILGGITSPQRNFVTLLANVDDSSANVISVLVKLFADDSHQQLKPVVIKKLRSSLKLLGITERIPFCSLYLFVNNDEPATTLHVVLVLPHRLDSLLEEVVIRSPIQTAGRLNVIVKRPKIFNRVEKRDHLNKNLRTLMIIFATFRQSSHSLLRSAFRYHSAHRF